jgi:hypothetical protein
MSYKTIATSTHDQGLVERIQAAIAAEQKAGDEPILPYDLTGEMTWAVCTAADVEAAYASALAAGNPAPGGDEAVITDGMILANVQANWPAVP